MKKHRRLALAALLLFFCAVPAAKNGSCGSQDQDRSTSSPPPESEVSDQETYTITASRLPAYRIPFTDAAANTSYIPANVTTKSESEIGATHPETLQESLQDIEGALFYDQVGNGVDTIFSLRGFPEPGSVVVLVDGVRVNDLDGNGVVFPLIDMTDMESIQVDRGSESHIYGSGAFAGVVHITTGQPSKKPVSIFGGAEISSFSGIRFWDGLSGTLPDKVTGIGGKWSYYFKGMRDLSHGYRANGEYRITNFDFKTAYELPDDGGRAYFGLKHVNDAISNPGELTLAQFEGDESRTNKPLDGRKYDNTTFHMGIDKKFWDNKITASLFNSWRYNNAGFFSTTGTFTDFMTGADPDTNFASTKSRQTELIWQLGYDDTWGPVENRTFLGMEFLDGFETAREFEAFGGKVDKSLIDTDRNSDVWNTALFWRESLDLYEKVSVYAGMRHDFYWLKSNDELNPPDDLSRRWRKSTVSAGVIFRPLGFWDVFANYSQGFRVPEISEIAPFSGTISQNLAPETSDSYETGMRFRAKDKAMLKLSWFLIDMNDEIVFDQTAIGPTAPFGQNVNLGKSRRTGIETRVDTKPFQELKLYASYTYTAAWVRETAEGSSIVDGRDLGQVPKQRATFGALLQPLKRYGEPFDGFRIGINGTATGRQHVQSYESTGQSILNALGGPGHVIRHYTLWNFLLSYMWREKEFYFKINNLFDNKYYSRAVDATSFGTSIYPAGDYVFVVPGARREYVGGMRWEF